MMKQYLLLIATTMTLSLSFTQGAAAEQGHAHDEKEHNQKSDAKDRHDDHDNHDKEHETETGHDEEHEIEGGHDNHGDHEESEGVTLSSTQQALANIEVEPLKRRTMDYQVYAPGEIKANGYTSYLVSPRVDSIVVSRHAALGDHVEKGQALVTLFSETVADAQAVYRVANAEWKRTQKLGRKAVGDKRYVSTQAEYEAALARLQAYGLSQNAIQSLTTQTKLNQTQTLGEYTLNAVSHGAVLSDDFHQGQRVESGEALMELANEKTLWVEARLAPAAQLALPVGTLAKVKVGSEWFGAKVSQEAHTIDPITRTRIVRLLVNNESHQLHPGQFADVHFSFTTKTPVLAVPEAALLRSADGDWTVFTEHEPGQFKAQEVELGRSLGKWREISDIKPGTRVVMKGAFFVASQIAKGGFDPHNH